MGYRRAFHVAHFDAKRPQERKVCRVVSEPVAGAKGLRGEESVRRKLEIRRLALVMDADSSSVHEREVEVVFDSAADFENVSRRNPLAEASCHACIEYLRSAVVNRLLRRGGRVDLADAAHVKAVSVAQMRPHALGLAFHGYDKRSHRRIL